MNKLLALIFLFSCATANAGWHKTSSLIKNEDTSRSETTTLADDAEMIGALPHKSTYTFRMSLHLISDSAVPDAKIAIHEDVVGSTIVAHCVIDDAGLMSVEDIHFFDVPIVVTISAATDSNIECSGVIFTNGASSYSLQWAQNTSNATATTLRRGSFYQLTAHTN
jgi:hypothetical protein